MGDVVNINDYRPTCYNCTFWNPPEKDGNMILKDGRCEHPGGWTPVWYGPPGPYRKMKCGDFRWIPGRDPRRKKE